MSGATFQRRGVILSRLEISSCTEASTGSSEDDAGDVAICGDTRDEILQLLIHLVRRRVHGVRAVESERRDTIADLV